ncbi:MAG: hypothetical protein ACP5PJ_04100 [Acidimicrobiales bacterium]
MLIRRARSRILVVGSLALAGALLSSCGGSNSVAGTSSTTCLVALEHAIVLVHSSDRVLGVREIPASRLPQLPFLRGHHFNVCVVGFGVKGSHGRSVHLVVYRQSDNKLLGQATIRRQPFAVRHLV